MAPARVVVTGDSLDELRRRVREIHGPGARIVAAQRVTVGGVGGLFARKHYEATVDVPDPATDQPSARVTITAPASRAGIAALLADADAADGFTPASEVAASAPAPADPFDRVLAGGRSAAGSPRRAARAAADAASASASASSTVSSADPSSAGTPQPATRGDAFAEIMDDLTFNGIAPAASPADSVAEEARPGPLTNAAEFLAAAAASSSPALVARSGADVPAPPAVLTGPGDLVVVVGRPGDGFRVAAQMAATFGLRSVDVADRRSAILARAEGVNGGTAVVTALAWDAAAGDALRSMAADQVWVAVDVGRKHDDTARWVEEVRVVSSVAAAAVVGEADTATPGTVHLLGVPVGWRESL
jgi:hypothetical protein